jgi:hypothetical protein
MLEEPTSALDAQDSDDKAPIGETWAPDSLAKMQAVRNLADMIGRTTPEHVAMAYARAITDPAEFRRRLGYPAEIRVPGGVLYTVPTTLWTPGIAIFPTNNREADSRLYPCADAEDDGPTAHTLWQLDSGEGGAAELRMRVGIAAEVVQSLELSYDFLLRNNDLRTSVAEHGVLMPITVVPMTLVHEDDDSAPVTILTAVDGSSRTAGAHRNLGLSPYEVLYEFTGSDREYRRRIHDVLAAHERGSDLTATERRRLRSIQVPANVVVDFRPEPGSGVTFHQAVQSLVGFIHVEPPKKWGPAGELDAKADAVLEALETDGCITSLRRRYMGGLLRPEQAEQAGLSPQADERAAYILQVLLAKENHGAVAAGVKRLVVRRTRVTPGQKVQIAVELAIRSFRRQESPTAVHTSRVALSEVYDLADFEEPWSVTTRAPEILLEAALSELESPDRTGPALRELAVLGSYHLARYRVLHRAERRSDGEWLDPGPTLRAMMRSAHGLRVLARAIVDGRAGRVPEQVDEQGTTLRSGSGQARLMDDTFLSEAFFGGTSGRAAPKRPAPTAEAVLGDRVDEVASHIDHLQAALGSLSAVPGPHGKALVEVVGIPHETVERMLTQLEAAHRQLQRYGVIDENRLGERDLVAEWDGQEVAAEQEKLGDIEEAEDDDEVA